jgi:hypothetical protein
MATTNTIPSGLQLTKVMNASMRALKRKLLPLIKLSTVFRDVPLQGDGTMALPFYPLTATGTSTTRPASGSRKAQATNTTTDLRSISNFTNKMQALSFTATEQARQPMFDPVMHGMLKGEALAYDILADIFSVVRAADFDSTSIAAVAASNFDEDEVADLRKLCADDFWPEMGRSLILNPSFGCNLLKQPQIIDASMRGDNGQTFRDGTLGRVLGFDVVETAGLLERNGTTLTGLAAEADTELFTLVAHGLVVGDRILFPALTGGSGITAATTPYFVKTVPSADTFTISATAGGATQGITTDVTDGSVRLYENIQGIAVLPSAILVGFAPVPPTPAIRKELFDYQQLVDKETGLTLQFYHFADPDTDEEIQTIECHFGYAVGDEAQLKIIRSL